MSMATESTDKFDLQDKEYRFPYHYIPHFTKKGIPSLSRRLTWGFQYLCYQRHVLEEVEAMKPSSVLEIGCGDGHFIGSLPESIPIRVGVDISERSIAFAKAFHSDCQLFACDAGDVEGQFDAVVSIEVLEHIPDRHLSIFFDTIAAKLSPTGTAILTVPTTILPLNRKHFRHYTIDLFERQLADSNAALDIVSYEYVFRKPYWYGVFKWFFNNHLFSLEVKPLMSLMWKRIWTKYRFARCETGHQLIVYLRHKNGTV